MKLNKMNSGVMSMKFARQSLKGVRGTKQNMIQTWVYSTVMGLCLLIPPPGTATYSFTQSFITTGGGRAEHTATLVDGRVVIIGGKPTHVSVDYYYGRPACYNRSTQTWNYPGPTKETELLGHTSTPLPNGKVLVVGGSTFPAGPPSRPNQVVSGAGIFDPRILGQWVSNWTPTGNMSVARMGHTATLLPNNKVLVAGGSSRYASLSSAEVYDPSTGGWTPTGSMTGSHVGHTATLLKNGEVLVVGGSGAGGTAAELYDPVVGTWMSTNNMVSTTPRSGHTATLLQNGKVLVVGGYYSNTPYLTCELFDPISSTWTAAGNLTTARYNHTAALLPNGKVVISGGETYGPATISSSEIYDPGTNTWTVIESMNTPRRLHTATLLPTGEVFIAGGWSLSDVSQSEGVVNSAELYAYTGPGTLQSSSTASDFNNPEDSSSQTQVNQAEACEVGLLGPLGVPILGAFLVNH